MQQPSSSSIIAVAVVVPIVVVVVSGIAGIWYIKKVTKKVRESTIEMSHVPIQPATDKNKKLDSDDDDDPPQSTDGKYLQ